jgi:hypothetical protein
MANNGNGQFLNVKQVAECLGAGLTEDAVRSMVARRTLPYRKLSGRVFFFADRAGGLHHQAARMLSR